MTNMSIPFQFGSGFKSSYRVYVAIVYNGLDGMGRNTCRCWWPRACDPSGTAATNVGAMGAKTAAHMLNYATVIETLDADVPATDEATTLDGRES